MDINVKVQVQISPESVEILKLLTSSIRDSENVGGELAKTENRITEVSTPEPKESVTEVSAVEKPEESLKEESETATEVTTLVLDDLQKLAVELSTNGKSLQIKSLLQDNFEVKKLSDLKQINYGEFYKLLEEMK